MPDRAAARTLLFSQKNVNTKQKQTERLISRSVSCFPVPSGLPHRSHCVPINMNRCGSEVFLVRGTGLELTRHHISLYYPVSKSTANKTSVEVVHVRQC